MRIRSIKFWATVLILGVCIITITLFSFLSLQNANKGLEEQYKHESQFVLNQTVQSFESQFAEIERVLEQLAQTSILKQDVVAEENQIDSLLNTYQNIYLNKGNIFYALENGAYYKGKSENIPADYNPVKQDWYQLAQENPGNIMWTEPYLNYMTQEIIITATKSVDDIGVLGVDFNLQQLSDYISQTRIGENGLVILLNRDGTILAKNDNSMIGQSLFGDQDTAMIQQSNERYISYLIEGKPYLIRSERIPQNGMSVVTAVSKEEIGYNLIKRHLPIFIVGVLCLLIFGAIAYAAALRGIKPLIKLGTLMSSVEKGDYSVTANVNDYEEVHRLAKGFNNMIKAIKKRDEKLLVSNSELKVADVKLRSKYEELKESERVLKASEEKILRLLSIDSLTGLLNRGSLLSSLDASLQEEYDGKLKAILFIDLDNFKHINDSLGHSFGDKVLIEIAKKLKSLSNLQKDVSRISGDEFILVIHDLDTAEEVKEIIKEIQSLFYHPIKVETKKLNVTVSIGAALYPIHANTSEELLKIADMAMYYAKRLERNTYRIFDEGIKREVEEKLTIESGIRECLDKNEFQLFFQPLYNTAEGRITSVEALLRTHTSSLSNYSILQIIRTAEEMGQIIEIDRWVIKQACLAIQEINKRISHNVNISINISALHIMHPDFVQNIKEIVDETGINPKWIELEITETSLMESFDTNKKKLEEIRKLGIGIDLDDFGTGYSSLNYLNTLPIDRVKIDKSFVDMMLQSKKDSKVIEAIIKLAHNLDLHVVAEGVEDQEQFQLLQTYQCEFIQGYYISKPVSYEDIIKILCE